VDDRRSRRLLRQSLEDPTENAIAQAAWLVRNQRIEFEEDIPDTSSFEANAWFARTHRQWNKSIQAAQQWQADQVFSSRPAILGSFVASTALEKHGKALNIAQIGLMSNPNDFTLRNNHAFALANLDRPEEALSSLMTISRGTLGDEEKAVFDATHGLVLCRKGDFEGGQRLYKLAIESLGRIQRQRVGEAQLYLASEAIRLGVPGAVKLREEALESSKKSNKDELGAMRKRIEKQQIGQKRQEESLADEDQILSECDHTDG